ncbi:small conductance mechanosensitive channel [Pustulibacterium marinum]|uniref:Small conductance mechanosensitive channel n=1 Tax=Pustulibacterium marinum TaxID=1224947 RepID=A0A1I7GYR9_9FLAO|nr:mechanosensitive ion channel family protein [Pustulibacterium marinum]SFU53555.1 small conductance mechanosensitive channel [Pustulibacterium marinum]
MFYQEETTEEINEQFKTAWDKMVTKLGDWFDAIVVNLPNFILAILVFVAAFLLSGYISKFTLRLLHKTKMQRSIKIMISKIVSVMVILIGMILALGIMNLSKVLTTILAGAGVAGLAVGLALQGTLSNTFSGIMLSVVDNIKIGDWVETNGYTGEVLDIDLRNTTIRQVDNKLVYVPNRLVVENSLKNYSTNSQARVILTCGVGYESNLEMVREVTIKVAKELSKDSGRENEVQFFYTEFGDSSINYELRFWVNAAKLINIREAKGEAIMKIKKAYDQHNINIPFPIRTINFTNPMTVQEKGSAKNSDSE